MALDVPLHDPPDLSALGLHGGRLRADTDRRVPRGHHDRGAEADPRRRLRGPRELKLVLCHAGSLLPQLGRPDRLRGRTPWRPWPGRARGVGPAKRTDRAPVHRCGLRLRPRPAQHARPARPRPRHVRQRLPLLGARPHTRRHRCGGASRRRRSPRSGPRTPSVCFGREGPAAGPDRPVGPAQGGSPADDRAGVFRRRLRADRARRRQRFCEATRRTPGIGEIDAAAARALPGVLDVITADDLEAGTRIPMRMFKREGMERFLQPPLARERVRYFGEPRGAGGRRVALHSRGRRRD